MDLQVKDGQPDGTEAKYYFRDRDLGQVFKTGKEGFRLGAVTVRLQPVDVAEADAAGAEVSVQIMKVTGNSVINHNGTTGELAPNGTSKFRKAAVTNAQWFTYATDWPHDPDDRNTPHRWPVMQYTDDFIEGETFEHIGLASGGIIPAGLDTNDYMRWEFTGESQVLLQPETTYAILFMFDEPAAPGVSQTSHSRISTSSPGGISPIPIRTGMRSEGTALPRIETVYLSGSSGISMQRF